MEKEKISESQVRQDAVKHIIDEPTVLELVFENKRFWRRLGVLPKKRDVELHGLKLGTLKRVSRILERINLTRQDLERTNVEMAVKYASLHMDDLVDIIALAIHNKPGNPPKGLKNDIMWGKDSSGFLEIVQAVIIAMDATPFTTSIILTSGMSLLKQSELIADLAPGE